METALIRSQTESTIHRCLWEGGSECQRVSLQRPPGELLFQQQPWPRPVLVEGAESRYDWDCLVLREAAFNLLVYSFSFRSQSRSNFLCKAVNFSVLLSISRL